MLLFLNQNFFFPGLQSKLSGLKPLLPWRSSSLIKRRWCRRNRQHLVSSFPPTLSDPRRQAAAPHGHLGLLARLLPSSSSNFSHIPTSWSSLPKTFCPGEAVQALREVDHSSRRRGEEKLPMKQIFFCE